MEISAQGRFSGVCIRFILSKGIAQWHLFNNDNSMNCVKIFKLATKNGIFRNLLITLKDILNRKEYATATHVQRIAARS
jgi:hypothetical protein